MAKIVNVTVLIRHLENERIIISYIAVEYFSEIAKNENKFKINNVLIRNIKITNKNIAAKNLLKKCLIEKFLLKISKFFKLSKCI